MRSIAALSGETFRRSGNLAQTLSFEGTVRRVEGDDNGVRAPAAPEVFAHDRLGDLAAARNERRPQARGRSLVRILIGKHLHAAGACLLHPHRGRGRQTPVVGTQRFHVADYPDHPGFFRDADHFLYGRDDADAVVPFVANVAGVDSSGFTGGAGERNHLFRPRKAAWRVKEATRQAKRSSGHSAANQCTHALELLGIRLAVGLTQDLTPDTAMPDEQGDVRTDPTLLQPGGLCREIDRAAPVWIHDNRGDTLHEDRLGLAQLRTRQSLRCVRMDVDEAGGHESIRRIDRGLGGR